MQIYVNLHQPASKKCLKKDTQNITILSALISFPLSASK